MLNVLIVEDDPMVSELNKKYLQMLPNFKLVGQVGDGQEALKFIETHAISLVLLDVFMPKLSGLELLQQIRSHYPEIDIIMVTAACNADNIQTALRLGVIDYIVKPFTFERFRTALITYQERIRLLTSEKIFDQALLDKRIFSKQLQSQKTFPKGIDIETLKIVQQAISDYPCDFSMSDIVSTINLSRISLKKYMDYLEESGDLHSYLTYPAIGRPLRMYSHQNINK